MISRVVRRSVGGIAMRTKGGIGLSVPAPIGYRPPVEREEQYYRRQEAPAVLTGIT